MFTQLRLKNFKAWRDEHRLDLAPVTLVLGVNSAGKTSLLQPLLLLKQTAESPDRHQHLNLGGQTSDVLHLGTYEDLISEHERSRELAFGVTLRDAIAADGKAPPSSDLEYDVSYALATGGVPVVRCLRLAAGDRRVKAERQSKGGYLLDAPPPSDATVDPTAIDFETGEPLVDKRKTDSRRAYEPERSIALSAEGVAALGRVGAEIQDMSLRLSRSLKNIAYLGP